jgi:hypothetical protein
MVHLGDEAQVEPRFSPFGDSVSVSERLVHELRQTYHKLIVCVERVIGLEIILDAPDGTPK